MCIVRNCNHKSHVLVSSKAYILHFSLYELRIVDNRELFYLFQIVCLCNKCRSQYTIGANGVMCFMCANTVVAVNTICHCVASPGAAGWSQSKGLLALLVTGTFCFNSYITAVVIGFFLLRVDLG